MIVLLGAFIKTLFPFTFRENLVSLVEKKQTSLIILGGYILLDDSPIPLQWKYFGPWVPQAN